MLAHDSPAIYRVEGDVLPRVDLVYEGVNLSQFLSIVMRVRRDDGKVFERTGVVDSAADGTVHFDFLAGDLQAGSHDLEFRFTSASGSLTIPSERPLGLIVRSRA